MSEIVRLNDKSDGLVHLTFTAWEAALNDARAAERERCARVAEDWYKIAMAAPGSVIHQVCHQIAAAIRGMKDE